MKKQLKRQERNDFLYRLKAQANDKPLLPLLIAPVKTAKELILGNLKRDKNLFIKCKTIQIIIKKIKNFIT